MKRQLIVVALAAAGILSGVVVRASHIGTPCSEGGAFHAPQGYAYKISPVVPDTPRPYRTAYQQKSQQWADVTCVSNFEVFGNEARQLSLHADFFGDTGWAGLWTPVATSGCHVTSANIKANRSSLDFVDPQFTYNVACHEHGHNLGLGEDKSGSTSTCMANGSDPGTHDIDLVNSIYTSHPPFSCF